MDMDALNLCDQEAIHLLSKIQESAYLLVLEYETLQVLQISQNIFKLLAQEYISCLDKSLEELFDLSFASKITKIIKLLQENQKQDKNFIYEYKESRYFCSLTLQEFCVVLEIKDITYQNIVEDNKEQALIAQVLKECQKAKDFESLCEYITFCVQELSGFDRVLLYKFEEDGSGSVLSQQSHILEENFLNHRFPASDIPLPARELYIKSKFRVIENAYATDALIYPVLNPKTNQILDMSKCYFRGVSQMHLTYLQNMGVNASMSISIVIDSKLWGLVACHHYEAKEIAPTAYESFRLLSDVFSAFIQEKERAKRYEYFVSLQLQRELYINSLSSLYDIEFCDALFVDVQKLKNMMQCDGIALFINEKFTYSGEITLENSKLEKVLRIAKETMLNGLYTCTTFALLYPDIDLHLGGVLVVKIPEMIETYLVLIRKEQVYTIEWAGNPKKDIVESDGKSIVSPRSSFESWKQSVVGTSAKFEVEELEAALLLAKNLSKMYEYFLLTKESKVLKEKQIVQENIILQNAIEKEVFLQRDRLLNSLGEGVYGVDTNNKCFFINPAALVMLAYEKTDVLHQSIHAMVLASDEDSYLIEQTMKHQKKYEAELWFKRSNNEKFLVKTVFTPYYENATIQGVVVAFTDITQAYKNRQELEIANTKLQLQARTDSLTQLFNQRYFKEYGLELFDKVKELNDSFTMLAIEIDHFKDIKKNHGNEVCDLILIMVAKTIKSKFAEQGLVARTGCEEFSILVPESSVNDVIEITIELVEDVRKSSIFINGINIFTTISVGMVSYKANFARFIEMNKLAAVKLYLAQDAGGNCIKY